MAGRILVVGSGGFIGGHLVHRLRRLGGTVMEIKNRRDCDLRDYEAVKQRLQRVGPDVIIHLAASMPDKRQPVVADLVDTDSTVLSVVNVIRALPRKKQCIFIYMGSYKQYGNVALPFRERDEVRPQGLYSVAKCRAEEFVRLNEGENLKGVYLRVGSTYGPNQDPQRLIPQAIKAIYAGESRMLKVANTIWDPIYVEDVLDAIQLSVVTPAAWGKVINISGGICRTPREVLHLIARELGKEIDVERLWSSPALFQIPFWGDITLAREVLCWQPKTSLSTGLRLTIEHYLPALEPNGSSYLS